MNFRYVILSIFVLLLSACLNGHMTEGERPHDNVKAAMYHTELGLEYLKHGNRALAKHQLLVALSEAPHSLHVMLAMGYFMEETQEFQQAEWYYKQALRVGTSHGAVWNNYGAFLCRRGDYRQALILFTKAINDRNYEHTAAVYENAGVCMVTIPDEKKALFYFRKALLQDPSCKKSLYEIVRIELKLGRRDLALKYLKNYQSLVSQDKALQAMVKKIGVQ